MKTLNRTSSASVAAWCAAIALAIVVSGCGATRSAISGIEDEPVGTAVGAGIGALAGGLLTDSGFGAVLGGIIGGYAGQQIAKEWDDTDRNRIETAMTTNEPVSWTDRETNLDYTVRPGEVLTGYRAAGTSDLCRRFTMQVGAPANANLDGVACREGSTWRIHDMRRM